MADEQSNLWIGGAHGLVARDAELLAVREHLGQGARVATLLGVAGSGKTSMVSAAARAAAAEGWAVIRLRGHATEQLLGFATLLDLVDSAAALEASGEHDRRGTQDTGPASPADSFRDRLMAGAKDAAPDGLRLRRDLYQWLLALTPDRPLLVVVDDSQWVDPASAMVLTFVANRLVHSEVSFLFASRADVSLTGLEDQPVVRLRPFDASESLALLHHVGPVLDPMVRAAIVDRAAGNPLALLELARVSGIASSFDGAQDHDAVPTAVESAFAADLPSLPRPTRELLLLAAAGADDVRVLGRAGLGGGDLAETLEPAERAGLIRVRGQRVSFRHPLIGSTIYGIAITRERQAAHTLLAGIYDHDDDRRVWHLASAADTPDEDVALELMGASQRLLVRGAQREAVEAIVRASELTPDPAVRDERLLEGVSLSTTAGHVNRIAHLAERLRTQTSSPLVRARANHFLGYAMSQSMRQSSAQKVLEESLEELIKLDDAAGWASLTSLASLTYQTCQRREALATWLERYESLTPNEMTDNPLNAAARAWIQIALDPLARPHELKALLRESPLGLPDYYPDHIRAAFDMLLGATAWLLDEHPAALRHLTVANDLMQRSGHVAQVVQNTMALGQVQFDMGLYDAADLSGRLMIDIGEAEVLAYYQSVGRELRARVASVRGHSREALDAVDRLLAQVEPGQSAALEANLFVSRAHALFGLRDHEAAYLQLRELFDARETPLHPHVSFRALGDLVSAAVRVGRGAEVEDLVRAAEARMPDLPGERMTRTVSRAKALISADREAGPLFERAIHEAGAENWPFERACAQLDYGVWLRRRRAGEAREQLRLAHQTFVRLGAVPWAAAAEVELRAAGVRLDGDGRSGDSLTNLTTQEREIALLAASGLSNKEIGESLFLSPRTVGAHLYHAFPKLGITSRTQLRDLVDQIQES